MTFLSELIDKALKDEYLDELIFKCENNYFSQLMKERYEKLTEKEYCDILRFADILCRDDGADGKNKAYKIISLLYDEYKNDEYYKYCCNIILTKLGNFPSLKLAVADEDSVETFESKLEKEMKREYQKVPNSDKVFTDTQYRLFEAIKDSNHFSFSGPTSFGKSFIMDAFIKYIIEQRKGGDNLAILVPTRALINQVSKRLRNEIKHERYKVLSHPVIPSIYKNKELKYIFVFTPERLISYFGDKNNPVINYMFIDEAQKIIATNDSRAPLYYHAILMAERKSVKLYFASPNIPNAGIFLQLFEKSSDETMVINESPVAQNKFYIDFIEKKEMMFTENGFNIIYGRLRYSNFNELLLGIGSNNKNIIYCNSIDDTIQYALKFSEMLPTPEYDDSKIDTVIELIQTYIHKDYYLIDCLKKRVAFHFGRLPQRIREKIESLFEDKVIDYMFCTSTLLEGVNLPAKNIFILNNAIGTRKFTDIDFWNLAGRAGRLSKELSGNIICVRTQGNKWSNPDKDLEVLKKKTIPQVEPTVIKGEKNFYKNVEASIVDKKFTKKGFTQTEKEVWDHYANIVYTHQISKTDSILISNFIKKNSDSDKILDKISKENKIPIHILEQCSSIKAKYQNKIWKNALEKKAFPDDVSYESCYKLLCELYNHYEWNIEEAKGRNPIAKEYSRLKYFAVLMYSWISAKPLNYIIIDVLSYYKERGKIWYKGEEIPFMIKNKLHINLVINNLIADIDNALRYKIKNYVQNYYLIIAEKYGSDIAGPNWTDYLEYGTIDQQIIDLQNIGIPRHLAILIKDECMDCIIYEDGDITDINIEKLVERLDKNKYATEIEELSSVLVTVHTQA